MAPPSKRRKLSGRDGYVPTTQESDWFDGESEDVLPVPLLHAAKPLETRNPHAMLLSKDGENSKAVLGQHLHVGIYHSHQGLRPREAIALAQVDSAASIVSGVPSTLSSALLATSVTVPTTSADSTDIAAVTAAAVSILNSALNGGTTAISEPNSISSSTQSGTESQVSSSTSLDATATSQALLQSSAFSSSALSTVNSSISRTTSTASPISSLSKSSYTSTSSSTSRTSSNATQSALLLVTVGSGQVTSLSQSSAAYTTTLDDGSIFTVPPATSYSGDVSAASTNAAASEADSSPNSSSPQTNSPGPPVATAIGGSASTTASSTSATGTSLSNTQDSTNTGIPPETQGTIAGGVVGGAAGVAIIVFIAMLFFRWYRRRAVAPPATRNLLDNQDTDGSSHFRSGRPGMAERAGLMPLIGALPSVLRHQRDRSPMTTSSSGRGNSRSQAARSIKSSGAASHTQSASPTSERGFTRISGWKMPSQFSPGIVSGDALPPPPVPPLQSAVSETTPLAASAAGAAAAAGVKPAYRPKHNPFSSSQDSTSGFLFAHENESDELRDGRYSDSHQNPSTGVDSRETFAGAAAAVPGSSSERLTMSPGPRRQPTVHRGGPYKLAPQSTVNTPSLSGATAEFHDVNFHDEDDGPPTGMQAHTSGLFPPFMSAQGAHARSSGSSSYYGDENENGEQRDEIGLALTGPPPARSVSSTGGASRGSRFTEEMR